MITFQALLITILSSLIACALGALISFFITTISQRKVTTSIIKELIVTHEAIHHPEDKKTTEELIKEHYQNCTASKEIEALQKGIDFLITKAKIKEVNLGTA